MRTKIPASIGFAVLLSLSAGVQQSPSQKDIDAAIQKGSDYLLRKYPKGIPPNTHVFELVVYTLIHAELDPKKTPVLKQGIEDLINYHYPFDDPKNDKKFMTYRAAIRCLALHSLLVKIKNNTYYRHLQDQVGVMQKKIAESAQWLVDTQLDNGQWGYGGQLKNNPVVSTIATGKPMGEAKLNRVAGKEAWENASNLTGTLYRLVPKFGADPKTGTDLGKPVEPGKQKGDNSNAQYGVLGLIAAERSGIEVPRTTWELALKWFESAQWTDGSYGYIGSGEVYYTLGKSGNGSMTTAGAVGLAAGYKYMGQDFRKEKRFLDAVKWLEKNFSVRNPNRKDPNAQYYYLYGLERVGAFSGLQKLGSHDWYAEGAAEIIKNQKDDGSWKDPTWDNDKEWNDLFMVIDTCFAILFLKRATSDMIDSGVPAIDQK